MGELYAAAGQPSAAPAPPPPPPAPVVVVEEVVVEDVIVVEPEEEDAEPEVADEPAAAAAADTDVESARLVALNMALNGDSRAQVDKYLADNYDLGDRDALLDDVYATVDG
jgi:hypothetical protein